MHEQMAIRPEESGALAMPQECAMLREAVRRNPMSGLRLRLANLLNQMDAFDETIALLTDGEAPLLTFQGWLVLAKAHFARETAADTEAARHAAEQALALATNDTERAAALADRAKAGLRAGAVAQARADAALAMQLDPGNRTAFKRLALELLRTGEAAEVIALTDRLMARGVCHSRILAARTMALAALGRTADAQATVDPATFGYHQPLTPPAGWSGLDAFNMALAAELMAHPGLRFERYGTSSRKTWRIDSPAGGASPLVRALVAQIGAVAERHAASLVGHSHPWISARPRSALLHSWCVITESDGYEDWHTHPLGWMSGGYYVAVPEAVDRGDANAGCLAFGLPGGLIGQAAAERFGMTVMRPRAGSLTLFPSHGYHRTFPHGDSGRRICLAFDIVPEAG